MRLSTVCLLALATAATTFAQSPAAQTLAVAASTPHYDVVSIKPNKSDSGGMSWRNTGDSFSATNFTLSMLLVNAYNTREDLISGIPAWAKNTHFDVSAKIVDLDPEAIKNLTQAQKRVMLVEVLTDRFHLQIHPETRDLPVYDLVLAKDGAKFKVNLALPEKPEPGKPRPAGMGPGSMATSDGKFTAIAVPLSSLTYFLASQLQRNIIDRTGFTAHYDFLLKWTPDRNASAGPDSTQSADAAPPLFTALQEQLGLKLVPAKGPVQTFIVDHVEQPTEN